MRADAALHGLGLGLLLLACNEKHARAQLQGPFEDALVVNQAFVTGVDGATDIAFHPDGRAVITQKGGGITVRAPGGEQSEITGTFPGLDTSSEKGLLGVVADPAVATNDTFYFFADTGPNEDKHRVYKGVLNDDGTLTVDLANPIVAAARGNGPGLEGPANHDGGGIAIHEGKLYIGVGDTGANASPPTNKYASCLNKGNGKLLRVNLDGSVPADNPLTAVAQVTACDGTGEDWTTAPPDRRIFAWGFRNPWRFWIDPHTDLVWVGDVGEQQREEITVVRSGEHHGYPFFEGFVDHSMASGSLRLDKSCDQEFSPSRPCTPPVHDYGHGEGTSVTGGLIPEGCGWTNAFGGKLYYLFADYNANWMHALEVKPDRSGVVSPTATDFGTFTGGPVSIRQGLDGGVYVVFYGSGNVTRIAPAAATGSDCEGGSGTGGTGATGGASGAGGSAGRGTAGSGALGSGGGSVVGRSGNGGGCGCRVAPATGGGAALAALGLAAVLVARLRRRGRRS